MAPSKAQHKVAEKLAEVYADWIGYGFGTRHLDKLVAKNSFAFIIGVLFDGGGVTAEQAWAGMYNLGTRLKREKVAFDPQAVAGLHLSTLRRLAAEKPCVHRYHPTMAKFTKLAAKKIVDEYGGDADAVFDAYSAREVFHRLMKFKGISDKKANMAVRLLCDELGYEYEDVGHMNVPVDVQVVRVFRRSGLTPPTANRAEIQKAACDLYPEAPWTLDAAWNIGYQWCKESKAMCDGDPTAEEGEERREPCPLSKVCPKLN